MTDAPDTDATAPHDPIEDLRERYRLAVNRLIPFVAASRGVVADGHGEALADAVRLRRAAQPVLSAKAGDDPAALRPALEDLEVRVAALMAAAKGTIAGDQAIPTDQLNRFLAWFDGEADNTVPPAKPKPDPKPKSKPVPKRRAGKQSDDQKRPRKDNRATSNKGSKPRRSGWGRLWRFAALIALALVLSGLRDGARRDVLAADLRAGTLIESRSFGDVADWAGSVNWGTAISDLSRFAAEDVGWVVAAAVVLGGDAIELVTGGDAPEPELVAAEVAREELAREIVAVPEAGEDRPRAAVPPVARAPQAPAAADRDTGTVAGDVSDTATSDQAPAPPVIELKPGSGVSVAVDPNRIETPSPPRLSTAQGADDPSDLRQQFNRLGVLYEEQRRQMEQREAELAVLNLRLAEVLARSAAEEQRSRAVEEQNAEMRSQIARLQVLLNASIQDQSDVDPREVEAMRSELAAARGEIAELRFRVAQASATQSSTTGTAPPRTSGADTTGIATHRVSGTRVNARSGPGTNFSVVTTLPQGARLSRIDEAGGWMLLRVLDGSETNTEVWISGRLLQEVTE